MIPYIAPCQLNWVPFCGNQIVSRLIFVNNLIFGHKASRSILKADLYTYEFLMIAKKATFLLPVSNHFPRICLFFMSVGFAMICNRFTVCNNLQSITRIRVISLGNCIKLFSMMCVPWERRVCAVEWCFYNIYISFLFSPLTKVIKSKKCVFKGAFCFLSFFFFLRRYHRF